MSQGSLTVADGDGGSVLAAINAALARLATKASGTARPSDIATGEFWIETDNPGSGTWSLWLYDGASDILAGTINSTTHALTWAGAPGALMTTKGDLIKAGASGVPARLAVGSAYDMLQVNAAGDDLEYVKQGWRRLGADAVPSAASTVTFNGIGSTVKALQIVFNLRPATNNVALQMQFSASAAFDTSAVYDHSAVWGGPSSSSGGESGSGSAIQMGASVKDSSGTSGGIRGRIIIADLQVAEYTRALMDYAWDSNSGSNNFRYAGQGVRRVAGPIDGFRLQFSSGNIAAGRVSALALYA
jgi:hypothetical protein